MFSSNITVLSALVALFSVATAQTSTSCNPTNENFTQGQHSSWTVADYTNVTYGSSGAVFTIDTAKDAPTITTDFYIFFGYVEVKMKAAPGTGIVSSIVLLSDDLDEIDYEFLGGSNQNVQTNFFGKGNTTVYNREVTVAASDTTTTYHTYALNWTSSSLSWIIDGAVVRTLLYTDALALGGKNYPQTPCRLKLGSWAGGASSSPGTVAWAGGATNFADGPFTMYVDSVSVTNYNPGAEYTWSDKSGDYTSIKVVNATSSSSSSSTNSSNNLGSVANTTIPSSSTSASASTSGTALAASSSTSSPSPSTYHSNAAHISSSSSTSVLGVTLLAITGFFCLF